MITQKTPSLRTRYFSLTLILATIIIGFVFNTYLRLSEKNEFATQNLLKIDKQLTIHEKIRTSISNIYRSIDLFLLHPKKNVTRIHSDVANTIKYIHLLDVKDLENTLQSSFNELQPMVITLIEIRTDANLQYPGMSISANSMAQVQSKIKGLLNELQREIEDGDFEPKSKQTYSEVLKTRILIEKEISQSRIYMANRLASFSNEILVSQANSLTDFHLILLKKLNHLGALYENESDSFDGPGAIREIKKLQNKWYLDFIRLRETSESDHWQEDLRLMEQQIIPSIESISALLIEHRKHLSQQKKTITNEFKDSSENLFYILAIIITVFLVFIAILLVSLELMIFKPIIDIANVMKQKAFGNKKECFSQNQSKETQRIVTAFNELENQVESQNIQLKNAVAKAIKANIAKSRFLANMSHELRTPLHGILNFSELGINKHKELDQEKSLLYFDSINQSGKRLLFLLSDLLDLARLESGRSKLSIKKNDLYLVTSIATKQLSQLSEEKKLSISIHCENSSLNASFDEDMITQVINKLLSNAIKYTPENNSIDIYLSIEKTKDKNMAKFMINDEGIGIPENEFETIFDKFIESSATQSSAGGTGLGLALCAQIIKLHNGTIFTQKTDNKGACFIFTIPVEQEIK